MIRLCAVLFPEYLEGGLDVFGHNVLGFADGARRSGPPLPLRLEFLLADPVHVIVVRLPSVAVLHLQTVTLVLTSPP